MPLIVPLGDSALLVRFDTELSDTANIAATAFARRLAQQPPSGLIEIVPSLVSVLVRYDPQNTSTDRLAAELGLVNTTNDSYSAAPAQTWTIPVRFGGSYGPDFAEVLAGLGINRTDFIAHHNQFPLRVLATGFAPGFVYCGFHPAELNIARRPTVRRQVPKRSILFAVGQTAITATDIPTGWHVIGQTNFQNFDPNRANPTTLRPGDLVNLASAT